MIGDYEWNRASSASSKSHTKSRQNSCGANGGPENGLANERTRPLSISSERADKDESVDALSRAKSLVDSNSAHAQHNSSYKQSFSVSSCNSHDPLMNTSSNTIGKTLSVEHRAANMSQMSISSQLSKNNSIRHHHNRSDTPNQHLHSATPTPRESIVFNRGDEKPIAKILHNKLHNELSFSAEDKESDVVVGKKVGESKSAELNGESGEKETKKKSSVTSISEAVIISSKGNDALIQAKIDGFNRSSAGSNIRPKNESYSNAVKNDVSDLNSSSKAKEDGFDRSKGKQKSSDEVNVKSSSAKNSPIVERNLNSASESNHINIPNGKKQYSSISEQKLKLPTSPEINSTSKHCSKCCTIR